MKANTDFWFRAVVVLAVAGVLLWAALGFNQFLRGWLP
jgi:multisubunit Na+/H+ antiporter MnhB subunit